MSQLKPEQAATGTTPTRSGLWPLLAASGVSSLGDGMFVAAAPLAAAALTRDPAAVSLVAAAEYLPWLLVAPFAGVYLDRWPKRTTMIAADLLRAVAIAGLALLIAVGSASIPALAVCAFVIVSGTVFHTAASEGAIA